jgi:hypothetical protein
MMAIRRCHLGFRVEAGDHQEQDAPEEMMDVKPACGDDISEGAVREQLEISP